MYYNILTLVLCITNYAYHFCFICLHYVLCYRIMSCAVISRGILYNIYSRQVIQMENEFTLKNRDRFIQLGIAISAFRKMRGMSQEQLAEKAQISRSFLSNIEAPNIAQAFSLDIFFNIADALDIKPSVLIDTSHYSDNLD